MITALEKVVSKSLGRSRDLCQSSGFSTAGRVLKWVLTDLPSHDVCTFERYTLVWMLGTGLQTSLAPGDYEITGEDLVDGVTYYRLEGAYRVDSCCIEKKRLRDDTRYCRAIAKQRTRSHRSINVCESSLV